MATITKGKTFTNGELVTPATIHQLVDAATISGIVNADIAASAAIVDTKLAQISTANKVAQSAVTNLTTDLAGKAASSHTHDDRYYTETEIDNKLSGLPVSDHTHTIANVTGLQTALNGKQASGSYAPATGIAQSAVTNLTTDLAGKAPTNHTHGNITNAGAIGATANLPVVTTASGVLTTVAVGTAGQVLTSNGGSSAPSFQTLAATSTSANNLTGGSAGTVPYQSAAGTTAMLAAGTSGQVLRSNGTAAPSWLTLGNSAALNTGTVSGTVATGDHTHTIANVTGLQTALDGKQASGSYAPATGIAQSAVTNLTTDLAGKAPTSHTHGNITNAGAIGATANLPVITGVSGVLQAGSFGTLAGSFCQGNDPRLADARAPVTHTHSGSDITSGTVSVVNGGTGATNAATARTNLGLGNVANIDGTSGGTDFGPSAGSAGKIVIRDSDRRFFAGRVMVTNETLNYGVDSQVDIMPGRIYVMQGTGVSSSEPNLILGHSYDSSSGVNFIRFLRNGNGIGSITKSEGIGVSYNTSSDYRLKTNLEPLSNAVARLLQIPVHRFNWLADPNGAKVDGFLAHEAQAIVPESVTGHKDEVDAEGKPIHQGIDQSKLVPLLVAAVQELAARVAALETR